MPSTACGSDHLETGPDGSFLLSCAISKGWIARSSRASTRVEHPGTAVRWEEEIFEVVEVLDGGRGVRYRLEPWDSRHAIRIVETYDDASEASRYREQARRRGAIGRRALSWILAPLFGHLPGPVQERMEGDFGAPARAMTILSALPLFALGAYGLLASRIAGFGGEAAFPPWLVEHPGLWLYLFVESGLRLVMAILMATPMGSLPGVIAYEIWRRVWRGDTPQPPRLKPARGPRWKAADSFKMLEPLLPLLTPAEQESLEMRFGLETLKWGRRGAVLILAVAILNLVISAGAFAQGRQGFWDVFWLAAGLYLAGEQIARLRRLRAGRPAGSVLAALVRPLARSLLAGP